MTSTRRPVGGRARMRSGSAPRLGPRSPPRTLCCRPRARSTRANSNSFRQRAPRSMRTPMPVPTRTESTRWEPPCAAPGVASSRARRVQSVRTRPTGPRGLLPRDPRDRLDARGTAQRPGKRSPSGELRVPGGACLRTSGRPPQAAPAKSSIWRRTSPPCHPYAPPPQRPEPLLRAGTAPSSGGSGRAAPCVRAGTRRRRPPPSGPRRSPTR